MKKGTKNFFFFFLSVATLAGMYAYNQFVASTSTKKNMLPTQKRILLFLETGKCFFTQKNWNRRSCSSYS